jgi:hypothetical protein
MVKKEEHYIEPVKSYIDKNGSWIVVFNEKELTELFNKYKNMVITSEERELALTIYISLLNRFSDEQLFNSELISKTFYNSLTYARETLSKL